MTPVSITWADAYTAPGWFEVDAIPATGCLQRSVGFLVAGAVPGCLTLAQTVDPDGRVGDLLHVPLGMVREIYALAPTAGLPLEPT